MPPDSPLATALAHARAAWPDVELDDETFAAYLRTHPGGAIEPHGLGSDQAAELYLACACAAGEPRALAHFDRHYLGVVRAAVAHMKLPGSIEDDVRQAVRTKLLIVDGAPPRLLAYAGRGRLRGLVQVLAVRTAISALRAGKREVPLGDDLERLPGAGTDPELDFMKAGYREIFKQAFEAAVRDLDSRQRNLLRLHLLGGVTLEQLAAMYTVHRATIVRWLARARGQLLAGTRTAMQARLQVDRAELDSLMGMIQSRLDASVHRLFATSAGDDESVEPAGD
jgi:RNA polymerase sigma-70 factor (ECF subfamily)